MALALTRRKGESVLIGEVTMTIVDIKKNGHVKLAFDGPRDVKIMRTELLEAVACQKRAGCVS